MHGWGSRDTLYPLYTHHTWGGGYWVDTPKNLPTLKDHLLAKFHEDPSSGLDFYTYTYIAPPPGGLKSKTKNMCLLKFDFKEILSFKYCTILKKNFRWWREEQNSMFENEAKLASETLPLLFST